MEMRGEARICRGGENEGGLRKKKEGTGSIGSGKYYRWALKTPSVVHFRVPAAPAASAAAAVANRVVGTAAKHARGRGCQCRLSCRQTPRCPSKALCLSYGFLKVLKQSLCFLESLLPPWAFLVNWINGGVAPPMYWKEDESNRGWRVPRRRHSSSFMWVVHAAGGRYVTHTQVNLGPCCLTSIAATSQLPGCCGFHRGRRRAVRRAADVTHFHGEEGAMTFFQIGRYRHPVSARTHAP